MGGGGGGERGAPGDEKEKQENRRKKEEKKVHAQKTGADPWVLNIRKFVFKANGQRSTSKHGKFSSKNMEFWLANVTFCVQRY